MLDPANDLLPPPSSPTNSSISSSDLDTESTGSFFHDRSITLGTLMGVTFPALAFRAPSQSQQRQGAAEAAGGDSGGARRRSKSAKKKSSRVAAVAAAEEEMHRRWRRRRWWRFCRDDGDSKPASLGEFLEVERRFGDVAFYGGGAAAAEIEGVAMEAQPRNGRALFADGRVLPPPEADEESTAGEAGSGGLCRFSVVSLSGICTGGAGCVG
ncbi:PREDICTED: uncharacterized protein At3g17950-like [Ipomoea nil]|uniref:uncharacterized protein At3g17950-like n=1 Tax=Ipomoea nil TaxID=35883 RepID=UPI0009012858|nr:PREDICTED: uncharacterized protein At3g17950-like [Ipomoea nil]